MRNTLFTLSLLFSISMLSCVRNTVDTSLDECEITVAYTVAEGSQALEVKSIIDRSCAYSGCHDGSSAPHDLTSFTESFESITSAGSFQTRVIDVGDMPPDSITIGQLLDDNDLQTIECWITGGYLEEG